VLVQLPGVAELPDLQLIAWRLDGAILVAGAGGAKAPEIAVGAELLHALDVHVLGLVVTTRGGAQPIGPFEPAARPRAGPPARAATNRKRRDVAPPPPPPPPPPAEPWPLHAAPGPAAPQAQLTDLPLPPAVALSLGTYGSATDPRRDDNEQIPS
jgi:hypothetical protein